MQETSINLPEVTDGLAVFDLDFTLWDCGGTWCDCTTPPYSRKGAFLYDRSGRKILLYNEAFAALKFLKTRNVKTAAASRTDRPDWAKQILELYGIYGLFDYHEIYPGSKLSHFRALKEKSGIPYGRMIFFDDEYRNISEVSSIGVYSVHVSDSNRNELVDTVRKWLENDLL